jgi:hypothetical protein
MLVFFKVVLTSSLFLKCLSEHDANSYSGTRNSAMTVNEALAKVSMAKYTGDKNQRFTASPKHK